MSERLAQQHLANCGVEIHMRDRRSPEQIVAAMVEKGVIPPMNVLGTQGMVLPADKQNALVHEVETASAEQMQIAKV